MSKHKRNPPGYWTYQTCLKTMKRYKFWKEFAKNHHGAVKSIMKNNWMKKLVKESGISKRFQKPHGYYTESRIIKVAKKCKTRLEFLKNHSGTYQAARRKKILYKVCKHMKFQGNRIKRRLYAFEHSDKSVYVGLTYNFDVRYRQHMSKNKILIGKKKTTVQKFITFDKLYHVDIAGEKEVELIEKYRKNGWTILNKRSAGSLGGSGTKRTFEECLSFVKKCKTRMEFWNHSMARTARKYRWLDALRKFLPPKIQNCGEKHYRFKWPTKTLALEALKYKTRLEFQNNCEGGYSTASRRNILNKICKHMGPPQNGKKKVKCLQNGRIYESLNYAAKLLKCPLSGISKVARKQQKQTCGYTFIYV